MSQDFDKAEWQAEQAERERIETREREKFARAKARAARNAKRKIERLRLKLEASGDLTDWENEFSESVSERLETFGSAFQDPQKGRPADALSFAQKRVVSALSKKARDDKSENSDCKRPRKKSGFRPKSGFKNKSGFQPRIRHIEDDMPEEAPCEPFLPEYTPPENINKRPFLKVVK